MLACVLAVTGCYERKIGPTYTGEAAEVTRIREHLGAITPEREFVKQEEEE